MYIYLINVTVCTILCVLLYNSIKLSTAAIKNYNNITLLKGNRYRKDLKKDNDIYATDKSKKNNHKNHPNTDDISKAVKLKIKELEPLCRVERDYLVEESIKLLTQKKMVFIHSDILHNLKSTAFMPKSFKKDIKISAST